MLSVLIAVAIAAAVDGGTPPDLMGWAAIISAVGVSFASIISALVLVITRRTDRKVTEIDRAVNGKAPGKPPMVDQVSDLHSEIPGGKQSDLNQAALLPLVRRLVALAEGNTDERADDS